MKIHKLSRALIHAGLCQKNSSPYQSILTPEGMTTVLSINDMNICSDLKHNAHSKAVLDDSWITVDTTSLHQHKLYYCDRSYLLHSESEQYKLRDSKLRLSLRDFGPILTK